MEITVDVDLSSLEKALSDINKALNKMIQSSDPLDKLVGTFTKLGKNIGDISSFRDLGSVLSSLPGKAWGATNSLLKIDGTLSKLLDEEKIPFKHIGIALEGLRNSAVNLTAPLSEEITQFGGLKAVLGKIILPIALVAAAIAGLVIGIRHLWKTNENFRNFVTTAWEQIKQAFSNSINFIQNLFTNFINGIRNLWDQNEGFRNFITGAWENISSVFTSVIDSIADGMGKRIDTTTKKQPSISIAQYSVFIST